MTPGNEIGTADLATLPFAGKDNVDGILETSNSFQEFKDRTEASFIKHQLERHNWNVSKNRRSAGDGTEPSLHKN